jgi:hypothetical protein
LRTTSPSIALAQVPPTPALCELKSTQVLPLLVEAVVGSGAYPLSLLSSAEAHHGLLKLIPAARMAEPEEVGWLVAFYASPAASYLTGTFTLMDGGLRDHNSELTPALHEMRALRAKESGTAVRKQAKAAHLVCFLLTDSFFVDRCWQRSTLMRRFATA